ncbi:unnamed protein product, partial [marine sediment metagenome]
LFLWAAECTRRIRTALYIRDVIGTRLRLLTGRSSFGSEEVKLSVIDKLAYYPIAWEKFIRDCKVRDYYDQAEMGKLSGVFRLHYDFFFWGSVAILILVGFGPLAWGVLGTGFELYSRWNTVWFFVDPCVLTAEVNLYRILIGFAIAWSVLCFWKPGWIRKIQYVLQAERRLPQSQTDST